jgi:hypothetical protein
MSLKLLCPFVYLDRQMVSRVHFVHPSRPCSSRVFYVNLTPEQVFALHVCINRLCFAIVRIQEVFPCRCRLQAWKSLVQQLPLLSILSLR